MDLQIRSFEHGLVDFINQSELPIEIKRLVLMEVLDVVKKKADEIILREEKEEREGDKHGISEDSLAE